jgi:hypothetical protein
MQHLEAIKARFLKDDVPTRLGGIAANLARLKSFSQMPNNKKAVRDLVEESKFFIEWAAPEASLEIQEELVNIQVQLALYSYSTRKKEIVNSAGTWAERVLKLSGLLDRGCP